MAPQGMPSFSVVGVGEKAQQALAALHQPPAVEWYMDNDFGDLRISVATGAAPHHVVFQRQGTCSVHYEPWSRESWMFANFQGDPGALLVPGLDRAIMYFAFTSHSTQVQRVASGAVELGTGPLADFGVREAFVSLDSPGAPSVRMFIHRIPPHGHWKLALVHFSFSDGGVTPALQYGSVGYQAQAQVPMQQQQQQQQQDTQPQKPERVQTEFAPAPQMAPEPGQTNRPPKRTDVDAPDFKRGVAREAGGPVAPGPESEHLRLRKLRFNAISRLQNYRIGHDLKEYLLVPRNAQHMHAALGPNVPVEERRELVAWALDELSGTLTHVLMKDGTHVLSRLFELGLPAQRRALLEEIDMSCAMLVSNPLSAETLRRIVLCIRSKEEAEIIGAPLRQHAPNLVMESSAAAVYEACVHNKSRAFAAVGLFSVVLNRGSLEASLMDANGAKLLADLLPFMPPKTGGLFCDVLVEDVTLLTQIVREPSGSGARLLAAVVNNTRPEGDSHSEAFRGALVNPSVFRYIAQNTRSCRELLLACIDHPFYRGALAGALFDPGHTGKQEQDLLMLCAEPVGQWLVQHMLLTETEADNVERYALAAHRYMRGSAGKGGYLAAWKSLLECRGLDRAVAKGAGKVVAVRPSPVDDGVENLTNLTAAGKASADATSRESRVPSSSGKAQTGSTKAQPVAKSRAGIAKKNPSGGKSLPQPGTTTTAQPLSAAPRNDAPPAETARKPQTATFKRGKSRINGAPVLQVVAVRNGGAPDPAPVTRSWI